MRSRNQRSWLMTTAQPAKSSSASSSARSVSTSRSLVGSSSSSRLPPVLSELGQVHAVALAARQVADLLLLVGALEVEPDDVGARRDLALAEHRCSSSAAARSPRRRSCRRRARRGSGRRRRARPSRRRASLPRVGLLLADDHAEQRRLAGAVGADDADDAAARQVEGQVLDQQLVAEGLAHVLGLDDDVAQARPRRDRRSRCVSLALLAAPRRAAPRSAARRALLLAWRARGDVAHPLELALRACAARADSAFSSCSRRFCFCSSQRRVVALPRDARRRGRARGSSRRRCRGSSGRG